ncbi:hypothetical protein GP486_002591 [Trichoglossum hirsutum]|uniref:NACHT domain-containing protein n=1 Tax=Trichoglossum hirsutum TaxID=265104 RepID=A0A9P8LE06_9PEZI|nr:hypothetical protein GP486_002591 [Trichoglossum hirsutum]
MSELNPNDYTAVWFAPLEIEALAALHMLDEEHQGRFPARRNDRYVFRAGKMCGHSIVIASFPPGEVYGTTSASILASHVEERFPNLRFGLLVGVAAGIPDLSVHPPRDIRLGDVLISERTQSGPGIVHYGLGKDTGQGKLQPLHHGYVLPNTGYIVRSAIGAIKNMRPNEVEKFLQCYESIKDKEHPTGTFADPGQENDKLYVGDDKNERLAEREIRSDSERTRVWCGNIGSGDKLLKDAQERDRLRDGYNLIGLEMEAAGIMGVIPVGVIRGVCDYADKRKRKEWQPYAAAMAAAYAKAILNKIPQERPAALRNATSDDRTDNKGRDREEAAEVPGSSNGKAARHATHGFNLPGNNNKVAGNFGNIGNITGNLQIVPDDLCKEFLGDLSEGDPCMDMSRIETNKGGILKDCFAWILKDPQLKEWRDNKDARLLWIKGAPGRGKTMLMIGLVKHLTDRLSSESSKLSFFFCQNSEPCLNNGVSVLRGLIWELLNKNHDLGRHIPDEYRTNDKEKRKAMFERSNRNLFTTLKEMLSGMLRDGSLEAVYVLVDALDECDKDLGELVEWIADDAADDLSKAKWLVSGRFTMKLDRTLGRKPTLELNGERITPAVDQFIEQKVESLVNKGGYSEELKNQVRMALKEKAESTFLWVALVCNHLKFISRLNVMTELNKFPPGLKPLYERMMRMIEDQDENTSRQCKQVLRAVTIAYRPLALEELALVVGLHGRPIDDIRQLVRLCGSYVILHDEENETIRFLHESAKDYLVHDANVSPGGLEQEHGLTVKCSLQAMSKILRKDIYSLRRIGCPSREARPPGPPNSDPLSPIRYSCLYWINHLLETSKEFRGHDTQREIEAFFKKHLLHWLEALSLMGGIPNAAAAINKLVHVFSPEDQYPYDGNQFYHLVRDAHRFIHYHKWAIENSPLQVYASALIFSPARSLVRELFRREEPEWITTKPVMRDSWSLCLQTLEGHRGVVRSIAFSRDDRFIASASDTIGIWDSASGNRLQTLEAHGGCAVSVAFSHDDKRLASVSSTDTVQIWDSASGECLRTRNSIGDVYDIVSAIFSHDDKHVVLTSSYGIMVIWDIASSECTWTYEARRTVIPSTISHGNDSRRLATASDGNIIRIQDLTSGERLQTFKGHNGMAYVFAFSHDNKRLASASYGNIIRIRDFASGECLQTLEGNNGIVCVLAFSHDNKRLASASDDNIIRIWDSASGEYLHTFEGHNGIVFVLAFSHDSKRLASASGDRTIRIWNLASGECLQTVNCHSNIITVTFSHDGKYLASGLSNHTIRIWELASGTRLQAPEGHSNRVTSVTFSHNGKHLASTSVDDTVKIWDPASGECLLILEGNSSRVNSIVFSHSGEHLASASHRTIRIWDLTSGECLQTLEGHSENISRVAFSHDDKDLASASFDKTIRIWDSVSGECLRTIDLRMEFPNASLATVHKYLCTKIDTILFNTPSTSSTAPSRTAHQNLQHRGLGVSSNGPWITYNSENLLWIPPEYRPYCSGLTASTVALGCPSGRVLIFNFDTKFLASCF